MRPQHLVQLGAIALLVGTLAACGGDSDDNSGDNGSTAGAGGAPWILGTTDTVTALDPAGSYDLGSSTWSTTSTRRW